jgi:hypothetical protein
MRSVKGVGIWTDDDGNEKPGSLAIDVEAGLAVVAFALGEHDPGEALPTHDRRVRYFLVQVQQMIRRREYASRPIAPDPKPKDRAGRASTPSAHDPARDR